MRPAHPHDRLGLGLAGRPRSHMRCARALPKSRRSLRPIAAGVWERSRAPHITPWAISEAQAEAIVGVRRAHPSGGPRKLRAKLLERAPTQGWPAPSTI